MINKMNQKVRRFFSGALAGETARTPAVAANSYPPHSRTREKLLEELKENEN